MSSKLTEVTNFTISAGSSSDLWRKPPSTDVASVAVKPLGSLSLSQFASAGATFSASWSRRYDQGGIAMFFTQSQANTKDKWVKAGVEFYHDKPYLSTVTTDNWSDWSLAPVTRAHTDAAASSVGVTEITVEARSEQDELGKSLWIYQVLLDADGKELERIPLRECTWVFAMDDDQPVIIAAYAGRPAEATGSNDELSVDFKRAYFTEY